MAQTLASARRTELEFVAFRWLAVLYGAIQSALSFRDVAHLPPVMVPLSFTLTGGLALSNIAIWSAAHRAEDSRQLEVIGAVAFVLDVVVVLSMTWTFTTGPQDVVWLIGFVLPLEGAARYGRAGALGTAIAFTAAAFVREQYLVVQFPPYVFSLKAVEFRCGMAFVIALTAGTFAGSFRLQTELANDRAVEAEAAAERQAAARARLQELDDLKSDFIAITSHELRTPASAIRGFVDTLRRRRDDLTEPEVLEFMDIIHDQSDRLVRLVEDLLDASRLEAGRLALEWQEVELAPFLRDCVNGMGESAPRVVAKSAASCPARFVTDPGRMTQILTNLMTNALKFSEPHTAIRLEVEPGSADALAFSVTDEGPGIPESELARIFERFEQAGSVSSRNAHGVGLGLYITRELVHAMGGSVTVASEVGVGSTFRVTVPIAGSEAPRAPGQPSPAAPSG